MAVEITMPRLSDSMEEGTVVQWLVEVGGSVEKGQPLVEIDTDKATMVYEAEAPGTLLEILVGAGDSAGIGAPIARVGSEGEEPPPEPAPAASARPGRANASPVARRLAQELGIDLGSVAGSGTGGLITREDVEAAAPEATSSAPPTAADSARGDTRVEELSRLQQTIARRMVEGSSAPTFNVETEVDMTRCLALRAEATDEVAPTINDLVVKGVALALRDFPRLNGSFTDKGFELYSRINVGIAVATDDGLVVPTLFDADQKTLTEIAGEARELAAKVRDRSIGPAELDGGTFTVSNLGAYGVRRFAPIVNPPQAAILGVGRIVRTPMIDEEGQVGAAQLMSATLVCDHRIVYGADGARFLQRLRELLEQPDEL